jgi:hypothetical protein
LKTGFTRGEAPSSNLSRAAQSSVTRIIRDTPLVRVPPFCDAQPVSAPLLSVKLFTSLQWTAKFADLAAQFDVNKADLQFDIQVAVGLAMANVKTTRAAAHQDALPTMTLVFDSEKMRSLEEREFAALVASAGGMDKVLANDALLRDVLGKFKHSSAGMAQQDQDRDDANLTPSSLRTEIAKSPDEIVNEDAKAFGQNPRTVLTQTQPEEVKQAVLRESDRVMAVVQGGPHERIVSL